MKLNDKQINILVDTMFDVEDLDWLERSLEELKLANIELNPPRSRLDDWEMWVNGRLLTKLDFDAFPEVLEEIKKLS